MAHSQRTRSGATLRPTLSSGSSNHIKSWFITTLQDSNLHYNHHHFPYPNQKNSSHGSYPLPILWLHLKQQIPRKDKISKHCSCSQQTGPRKNHTQVKSLSISVKTLPFPESQDKTGKVLKEFRHKYFTKTKGKRKGLVQINKQEAT